VAFNPRNENKTKCYRNDKTSYECRSLVKIWS
jgi:hypothetical protein